ncbi:MAG: thioredoxin family protein [Nitrososphaeria archaeon]|nr:thioredoxin family protein [Nitrososphaeria archaeon]MDW7985694.1 thioredoxin family protein [Nitrososphaerota archaeon]
MQLIRKEDREVLEEKFEKELENDVRIVLITKKEDCEYCETARQLVEEISLISEKLKPEFYDLEKDKELISKWRIDKVPATLLFGEKEYWVRFFGLPSGYEFTTFIEDIIDVSRRTSRLSPKTKDVLKKIDKPIHIQVFVTPSCPYCPRVVRLAHQFAIENTMITGDMIESLEFQDLARHYNVLSVPKTVVNDEIFFEGAVPEPIFLQQVLKALKP